MVQNNVNNRVDLQLIFEKWKIESMVELFSKKLIYILESTFIDVCFLKIFKVFIIW